MRELVFESIICLSVCRLLNRVYLSEFINSLWRGSSLQTDKHQCRFKAYRHARHVLRATRNKGAPRQSKYVFYNLVKKGNKVFKYITHREHILTMR